MAVQVLEFTYPLLSGTDTNLVAVIYNEDGQIFNPDTGIFEDPPRLPAMEITLEPVGEDFPGLFRGEANIPESTTTYSVRFEEQDDADRKALGVATIAPQLVDFTDLLAVEVEGTDTGNGLMTVQDVLRQTMGILKGGWILDRGLKRLVIYELDDETPIRTFDMTNNPSEASRRTVGA